MTMLLEVFWKSGAILGLALCVTLLLRKSSADVRRLVLSATIVATLLAALAAPILPRLNIREPHWLAPAVEAPPAASPVPVFRLSGGTVAQSSVPASVPLPRTQFRDAIPWIWLIGSMLLLTRLSLGLYGLRRMRRAARPISGDVLQSNSLAAPVTWGIIHPVILVPAGFDQLPEESREAVLCHERAHIQSYDFLFRIAAEITRALIWFQPLMWFVSRRLREEQELACDDRVLASGIKPSAYAKLLLDWDLTPATPAIGMASSGSLKRRLYAVLDGDTRRGRIATALVFATWILAFAAALPLAAMSWTRQSRSVTPAPTVSLTQPTIHPEAIRLAQAQVAPVPRPSRAPTSPAALFVSSSLLVIEDVTVSIANDGQAVQGLTTDDFSITEDGRLMRPAFAEMGRVLFEQQGLASEAIADYRIGYYSANASVDGGYRTVKVFLKNPNAKLDYRAGYYGPSMTPTGAYEPRNMPAGVAPPALIAKVEPAYSEEARKAKVSGTVTLDADVDASGKAVNIHIRQPLGLGLDEQAIEALAKWRFRPASQNGAPVSVPIRVWLTFYVL